VLSLRLGPDACKGFEDVLDAERQDWSNTVLTAVSERFERRLIEEGAKFRVDLATLGSDLRQEMAKDRFELLKWMFLFWVSQLAAMSGIVSFLLRR
jgi:regulation of enolase protein 1 (concanavalin A-like superfamily)